MSEIKTIASYNMSFASGLGLNPERDDVFESEGNFLKKNVEEQEGNINYKRKPTLDGGSKKRRAKKSFKKMHKRKHSMKKHRKSRK
jgi:hypothetical protein